MHMYIESRNICGGVSKFASSGKTQDFIEKLNLLVAILPFYEYDHNINPYTYMICIASLARGIVK